MSAEIVNVLTTHKIPCRLSNDLHEGWNDSIAVLRTCAGEILGSVKIR